MAQLATRPSAAFAVSTGWVGLHSWEHSGLCSSRQYGNLSVRHRTGSGDWRFPLEQQMCGDKPPVPDALNSSTGLLRGDMGPGSRCGFAALLGPSNSGKSTLLNRLVGTKVAIVTPKVQTTRCRVAGIVTKEQMMIIFLDTPGVFSPNGRMDRAMVRAAWQSASSGDVVSVIVDAAELYHRRPRVEADDLHVSEALEEIITRMPKRNMEYCICLNKIDTIPNADVPEFLNRFERLLISLGVTSTVAVFPMSARDGAGVDEFTSWVSDRIPAGPWLYPGDDLTDMSMRLIAAEVTREKAFMLLKHELPYDIAVETTSYKEQRDGSVRITQDIFVSRNSQKRIVTGQSGAMVKAIGMRARHELCEMTGTTVHLMLTVKIREKWKEDARSYEAWGLDFNA
jgi:GTPase